MDIERFQGSPVGRLVPIKGHDAYLDRDYSHYAFVPCPTPNTVTLSQGTYNSVAKAHLALGRLDFAVRRLPDPAPPRPPVLRREAQSTSELEGTYAPLDEVFAADFIDEGRRSAELREVMNYVTAAERALRPDQGQAYLPQRLVPSFRASWSGGPAGRCTTRVGSGRGRCSSASANWGSSNPASSRSLRVSSSWTG